MFKNSFLFGCLLCLLLVSCQKNEVEKNENQNAVNEKSTQSVQSLNSVVSTNHWYGGYTLTPASDGPQPDPGCDPDISDINFIKDGVAKFPQQNCSFAFTSFSFNMPAGYNIPGDSLFFEAVIKNPVGYGFPDYDVVMKIIGDQHSAEVHFVADSASLENTQYYVGNNLKTAVPALVHYFGDFETVKLATKNNQTAVYINGKLVYKFKYGVANRIGKVQTIAIAGKGYVTVNSAKLLNSYTNKKIMVENFNVDGQSHAVFY